MNLLSDASSPRCPVHRISLSCTDAAVTVDLDVLQISSIVLRLVAETRALECGLRNKESQMNNFDISIQFWWFVSVVISML